MESHSIAVLLDRIEEKETLNNILLAKFDLILTYIYGGREVEYYVLRGLKNNIFAINSRAI